MIKPRGGLQPAINVSWLVKMLLPSVRGAIPEDSARKRRGTPRGDRDTRAPEPGQFVGYARAPANLHKRTVEQRREGKVVASENEWISQEAPAFARRDVIFRISLSAEDRRGYSVERIYWLGRKVGSDSTSESNFTLLHSEINYSSIFDEL